MNYANVRAARFIDRPNRFIAHIELDGKTEVCHVKNTGRCRELLLPGARVYVQECPSPARRTAFDLIAVEKGSLLINMDSQAPNRVFGEWAAGGGFWPGLTLLKPETRFGSSRFDFYLEAEERRAFVEVKGVTLEREGLALFPDAPTERGRKHVTELMRCREQGCEACLFFLIQMRGISRFTVNDETDPAFGRAVRQAVEAGVQVLAYDCAVTPDSLSVGQPVEIVL
ncbi:MAG: DNA/RNA nuclease SfsA [Firmicutes bacterium]|nr:DNA/RNA nuclease SfsA [Bacillota bacterium]